ncbi:MAG: long-chain fatty acid--CoA ligase [Alphaproteobacteria bacterium]|nr:long-chain fatty acid--CoA ligase [Alphaproteobacteria bacterium]
MTPFPNIPSGQANLPAAFFAVATDNGGKTLLAAKRDGEWQTMTYAEVADHVRRLAAALINQGIKPGDKIFISSENRPEWAIADLAIMAIGAVVVPSFVTNTIDDFAYIMGHSDAVLAITSGGELARKVAAATQRVDEVDRLIIMDETDDLNAAGLQVWRWSDLIETSLPLPDLEERMSGMAGDDVCCFIYTSGTGGRPKGVMLTHRSIQANIDAAIDLLAEGGVAEDQRFLSLLPLSHSYEHTAGMHLPFQTRSEVWYCESADQIANNLAEVAPTLMTAVPRLYEVLHDRITRGIKAKGGVSEKLFRAAVRIGVKQIRNERLSVGEAMLNPVLDRLVRRKVKSRLGGRLNYFVSGGAALNPDIGEFFMALGVKILQGYGQTEASPLISANRPGQIKIASVGPAVRGVEVILSDDGEILTRGDMLMKGYWKDDEATAQTIQNGWLHTGDLGEVDDDGYITITGRKKDIIVNSGGDNIAPSRVEGVLTIEPEIEQVMVDGDKKPWLAAVVVPAPDLMQSSSGEAVQAAVAEAINRANQRLSKLEQVRRFLIADEPFTTDNGQMTATLKTRRHVIRAVYGERLDALYPKN